MRHSDYLSDGQWLAEPRVVGKRFVVQAAVMAQVGNLPLNQTWRKTHHLHLFSAFNAIDRAIVHVCHDLT